MAVTPVLPDGFCYHPNLITVDEERALVAAIEQLPLAPVVMRGFTARRRTVHYGVLYRYNGRDVEPGPPLPDFLLPVRARAASIGGIDEASLTEALITEYVPGAVIGWHRDAPMFGPTVVGISLAAPCRMRFRRGEDSPARGVERASIVLEPRSGYVLAGAARSEWQHSIPAVDALRYSITFRSVKTKQRAAGTSRGR
jgi:alkylated DNA repair protein (DNA oxidative demethylase)